MKTIRTILYTMAAMLILICGFLIGERVANFTVPHGKALVELSVIDSLKNIPPTILIDTVWVDTIIYRDLILPIPEPTPDSTVFKYTDHIVNAYSRLIIRDWIRGELVDREIEYTPYLITKTVQDPYPVYIKTEAEKAREIRLQAHVGLKASRRPGVEFGFSAKQYYISASYDGYYGLTLGRKFNVY